MKLVVALLTLLVSLAASPANAAIMTFEGLASDFTAYSSYTEDGIKLFVVDAGEHFFGDGENALHTTVGVTAFTPDGSPLQFHLNGGFSLFDLNSVEVWDLDPGPPGSAPITFTSSSGGSLDVTSAGNVTLGGPNIINFGPGFTDISWVKINIPDDPPGSLRYISIDNILLAPTAAVPEPSSLIVAVGLAIFGLPYLARRRTATV